MAETLAGLIGKCGPVLFRDYVDKRLHTLFPTVPPDLPPGQFGPFVAKQLADRLSDRQKDDLRRNLQRAMTFRDRKRRDLLEFALFIKGLKPRFPNHVRSAFQRALFLYLYEADIFRFAEKLLADSRYKFDRRFHDTYAVDLTGSLDAVNATEVFKRAVEVWIQRSFGDDATCNTEMLITQPLYPYSREEELQLLIFWGDDRDGIETFNKKDGVGIIFPHQLEAISISLNPARRTLTVCGKYLGRDGRQDLADIVARDLLGIDEEAQKLKTESNDLHVFLNGGVLRPPARGPICRTGITEVRYNRGPDTHFRSRDIIFGQTLRETLENDYAALPGSDAYRFARHEMSGAIVRSVDFRIDCNPSKIFPDGRTITGSIYEGGFSVDTKLDVDCYIAQLWFEHLRLRSCHTPLFGAAA